MTPDMSSVWTQLSSDPRDPASSGLRATDSDRHVVTSVLRDARNGFLGTATICCSIWAVTSVATGGAYFFWPAERGIDEA